MKKLCVFLVLAIIIFIGLVSFAVKNKFFPVYYDSMTKK